MPRQPKPFWYRDGWYTDAGGRGRKLLAKGRDNYDDAVQELHRYLGGLSRRGADPCQNPNLGLVELIDLFLDAVKQERSELTYAFYRSQCRRIARLLGNTAAKRITVEQVRAARSKLINAKKKPRTINMFVGALRRVYRWAADEGLIHPHDPTRTIRALPTTRRSRLVSETEYQKLLEQARLHNPAMLPLLQIARLMPVRPGEIRKLRWEQIDWERRLWIQREHKTATTARQPRPRVIAFPTAVEGILRDLQPQVEGFVFLSRRGRPYSAAGLSGHFARLRKLAGIRLDSNGESLRLYSNRHTGLTEAVRHGVTGPQLKLLAGWTSLNMAEYYIHLDERDLRQVAQLTADALEQQQTHEKKHETAQETPQESPTDRRPGTSLSDPDG